MKSEINMKPAATSIAAVATKVASLDDSSKRQPAKQNRYVESILNAFTLIGLSFAPPIVRLCRGENPRVQVRALWQALGIPLVAIMTFLFAWSRLSATIETIPVAFQI